MTNGSHKHHCCKCGEWFWCRILTECFIEDAYFVCDKPACIEAWENPKVEEHPWQ